MVRFTDQQKAVLKEKLREGVTYRAEHASCHQQLAIAFGVNASSVLVSIYHRFSVSVVF